MDQPGDRFSVDPSQLPAAQPGSWTNNGSTGTARPAGTLPQVPAGFEVSVFAEGLNRARWIETAPNGDVLLSRPNDGDIVVLRDGDGNGNAESRFTFATGFNQPHGMAIGNGFLYVVDVDAVWRLPYTPGETATRGAATALTPPGALGGATGHSLHSLALSPDGGTLFVGVGSEANLSDEAAPRATILQLDAGGGTPQVVASGLRNPAGLEFDPASGALYATVVERDGLGDDLVPDYLTRIQSGGFYGWPYAYTGPNAQPGIAPRPDLVARTITPDVLFEAHATPIGVTFYTGSQFPDDYQGDAFVALRGSWNASETRGFMVARVDLQDGAPINGYDAFMTGFVVSEEPSVSVYGRPTTVAVAANGSLLVGDDIGGAIYSVRYTGAGVLGGTAAGDALAGTAAADRALGLDGSDRLQGMAGDDRLFGNTGNDTLFGGDGEDLLFGGRDDDRLFGDAGDDRLSGDQGNDGLYGGDGQDSLLGAEGADGLFGNQGQDQLFGNTGSDTLYGGLGDDRLFGGRDGDWLFGDAGNDTLSGDAGNDTLAGGAGADRFLFQAGSGADVITDFDAAAGDRLHLDGGLGYTVSANALGEGVIVFGGGDSVTLAGIGWDRVQSGWFTAG